MVHIEGVIFLFCFVFGKMIFLEQFRLTTKLESYGDFLCTLHPSCTASPLSTSLTRIFAKDSTLTHYNHSKLHSVPLGSLLLLYVSVGLDQCVKTCIHHCSIIQSIPSAPQNPLCSACSSSPNPNPGQPPICLLSLDFCLFRDGM